MVEVWEGSWSDGIIDVVEFGSILGLNDRGCGANEVNARDLDQFGGDGAE